MTEETPGVARWLLLLGALNALLSVALGAFGAHVLEPRLEAGLMAVYHKASDYHGLHALGMIGCGLLALQHDGRWVRLAGWSLLAGILLFSGSLYLLALTGLRALGMVTPFGGLAFLFGWFCLCMAAWRLR